MRVGPSAAAAPASALSGRAGRRSARARRLRMRHQQAGGAVRTRVCRASVSITRSALPGSRLPVGSSASSSAARAPAPARSPRAAAGRRRASAAGVRRSRPGRRRRARAPRGRRRACSSSKGRATFCATVRCGSTWKAWKTKPMSRRRSSASSSSFIVVTSRPASCTRPASRRVEPGDAVEQGGFAHARFTEHRDELAGAQFEIDAAEHRRGAVALGETLQAQHRARHDLSSASAWRIARSTCAGYRAGFVAGHVSRRGMLRSQVSWRLAKLARGGDAAFGQGDGCASSASRPWAVAHAAHPTAGRDAGRRVRAGAALRRPGRRRASA